MAARLALAAAATQPAVTLSARSSLMITRRECSRRSCREPAINGFSVAALPLSCSSGHSQPPPGASEVALGQHARAAPNLLRH